MATLCPVKCRCQQREVAVSQREAAVASAEQDGDVLRKQLLELSAKAQAAASQDAVVAAEDRRRLQHDAARLDAAVYALEQQRKEIAAGIDMERQTLQATRAIRDEERKRFMQEISEERQRLAEERKAAWADMDRIYSETAQAPRKVVELEAQAAAALLNASKARDAKAAADMDVRKAMADLRMCVCPFQYGIGIRWMWQCTCLSIVSHANHGQHCVHAKLSLLHVDDLQAAAAA